VSLPKKRGVSFIVRSDKMSKNGKKRCDDKAVTEKKHCGGCGYISRYRFFRQILPPKRRYLGGSEGGEMGLQQVAPRHGLADPTSGSSLSSTFTI
jgi:hypothetical protein